MDLSVVIPVYDEVDNIRSLLDEITSALEGVVEYEVIFVDDASTDGTAETLLDLTAGDRRVRVETHSRNAGQSAGLLTGINTASADWIATMDGDGQNDPRDLGRLWERAAASAQPAALYIGHRVDRQDTPIRLLSSRIANEVRSRLLGDGVPDTGCGIKLFRRDTFLRLPYFDHMHRFLPALVRCDGGEVESVPVNHRPRAHGHSKYGIGNRLWVGIVDLLGVMWLLRRRGVLTPVLRRMPHGR